MVSFRYLSRRFRMSIQCRGTYQWPTTLFLAANAQTESRVALYTWLILADVRESRAAKRNAAFMIVLHAAYLVRKIQDAFLDQLPRLRSDGAGIHGWSWIIQGQHIFKLKVFDSDMVGNSPHDKRVIRKDL
ncbi:hypothetical protein ElyMa_000496200 [Elysia marginata]|uniref:Uncharacterized protein n=1 Tax=Elysia marginata TaxID=1093978 RepID=A0AAV4FW51_9GAST|nr:hypothetical protein ElyMa_000496200 [Elysia marginata]